MAKLQPTLALKDLCKGLDVDDELLKSYMKVFISQLNLCHQESTSGKSSLKCYVSYIDELPKGGETGLYLALHFAGTTVQMAVVSLKRQSFDIRAKQYKVPKSILVGSADQLFDFLADCIYDFTLAKKINKSGLPLGFVFGFPCTRKGIKSGILTTWTKEFKCTGVVGKDVVPLLEKSIAKIPHLQVEVCVLLNDTTGTLLSCAWKLPNCKMGVVHDEGTNIAYVEKTKLVPKYAGQSKKEFVIIETECGNLGTNGSINFLRTGWDKELDRVTKYPGYNIFEKMVSGRYLGELVRRVLVTAIQRNFIFGGKMTQQMSTIDSFETLYVIEIAQDPVSAPRAVLNKLGYQTPWSQDCIDLAYVCEKAWSRSGNLLAASVAAVLQHMDYEDVSIGFDGVYYRTHPDLQELVERKLRALTDPRIKFQCQLVDDRGGLGTAVATALAVQQLPSEEFHTLESRSSFFKNFDNAEELSDSADATDTEKSQMNEGRKSGNIQKPKKVSSQVNTTRESQAMTARGSKIEKGKEGERRGVSVSKVQEVSRKKSQTDNTVTGKEQENKTTVVENKTSQFNATSKRASQTDNPRPKTEQSNRESQKITTRSSKVSTLSKRMSSIPALVDDKGSDRGSARSIKIKSTGSKEAEIDKNQASKGHPENTTGVQEPPRSSFTQRSSQITPRSSKARPSSSNKRDSQILNSKKVQNEDAKNLHFEEKGKKRPSTPEVPAAKHTSVSSISSPRKLSKKSSSSIQLSASPRLSTRPKSGSQMGGKAHDNTSRSGSIARTSKAEAIQKPNSTRGVSRSSAVMKEFVKSRQNSKIGENYAQEVNTPDVSSSDVDPELTDPPDSAKSHGGKRSITTKKRTP